jgi:hypothetical protein
VIGPGVRAPDAGVWIEPDDGSDGLSIAGLADDGPFLLVFYVYDWTST